MNNLLKRFFGISKEKVEEQAREIYQVTEHNCELWLTFSGALICPMDLFSEDPLTVLSVIRKQYVERHTDEL